MKTIVYILFSIATLLLTFFGLGPVLMADGSRSERILTLVVVLIGYISILYLFLRWRKNYTK